MKTYISTMTAATLLLTSTVLLAQTPAQVYTTPQGTTVVPAVPVQPVQPVPVPPSTTVITPAPTPVTVQVHEEHDWPSGEFTINPGAAIFQGSGRDIYKDSFAIDVGWYGRMNQVSQMGLE